MFTSKSRELAELNSTVHELSKRYASQRVELGDLRRQLDALRQRVAQSEVIVPVVDADGELVLDAAYSPPMQVPKREVYSARQAIQELLEGLGWRLVYVERGQGLELWDREVGE